MEVETKKRMYDVMSAIERVSIHTANIKNLKDYVSNITVKSAVERELGIIGEAITRIKKLHPEIQLTGMDKIISFRNYIIHSYDTVSDDMVWLILQNHLPLLKKEVEELLKEK